MSYLDLGGKALAVVAPILLSEALGDLCGLVHSQEPVVTAVDVHDRTEVADVHLRRRTLLFVLLRRHGGCYCLHCVEDERRDLEEEDTETVSFCYLF